jgi:quinol monooxygenase YgiN
MDRSGLGLRQCVVKSAYEEERVVSVLVRAELAVTPGRAADAVELARKLARAAADEAGTLRYDWFGSEDDGALVVIEEYDSPEAAIQHNERCADLLGRIGEVTRLTRVDVHGDLDAALLAWIAGRPQARAHSPLAL